MNKMKTTSHSKAVLAIGAAFVLSGGLAFGAGEVETLVVSRGGFQPESLRARRGETLRVRIETADEEHCFALDDLRVEKRVRPGRPVLVELTPDRTGTFDFHCCLEPADSTPRGRLIVFD